MLQRLLFSRENMLFQYFHFLRKKIAVMAFGIFYFVKLKGRIFCRYLNPEKPDVPLNKNDAFQKVQKRHVQEKR